MRTNALILAVASVILGSFCSSSSPTAAIADTPKAPPSSQMVTGSFSDSVDEYPEHTLVKTPVETNAKFASIRILGRKSFTAVTAYPVAAEAGKKAWVWTGPPDDYQVWVDLYDPEKGIASISQVVKIVPANPPKPGPDDDDNDDNEPPPKPNPQPRSVTILIFEESGQRDQKLGDLFQAIRSSQDLEKHRILILDRDTNNTFAKQYVKLAGSDGFPGYCVVDDSDGRVLDNGKLPDSVDGLISAVRKAGG